MKIDFPRAFRYAAVAALLAATLASPAFAQRQRLVKRPDSAAATLSGRVVDASTRAPLAEARVEFAGFRATTKADGQFSFAGVQAAPYSLTVSRWGYVASMLTVDLKSGANTVEIALQMTPTVVLRKTDGTTVNLDFQTLEFGYVTAFVGWTSGPSVRICLPDGNEVTVTTAEMKTVVPEGTRTETTACCSLSPGTVLRVTTRDGGVTTGTIRESCTGAVYYVRARDRNNEKVEVKLSEVAELTFN